LYRLATTAKLSLKPPLGLWEKSCILKGEFPVGFFFQRREIAVAFTQIILLHCANFAMSITVGLADNDQLFLKSLGMLINSFDGFEVLTMATNGQVLVDTLKKLDPVPDLLLLDVNMPVKDGVQTAQEVRELVPTAKMIALSVNDSDGTVIRMVRSGCCAYLLKDMDPGEFQQALIEVHERGYYNGDLFNRNARHLMRKAAEVPVTLNAREKAFLQLASTDLTYKQIAAQMYLSERTVDGYRETLFEKFNVQSRVGMVLEGLRREYISL
jgi:DNA-binding NarL/FixJ family response regulator